MTGGYFSVLDTLAGIAERHGKPYCYPSQLSIMRLLKDYHGLKLSRRTLNRWLFNLELAGYFKRVRRHRRGNNGEIIFKSTLYKLTGKLFNAMGRLAGRLKKFFGVFRVPKMAQYQTPPGQVSGLLPREGASFTPSEVEKVRPVADHSAIKDNLAQIRDLLSKIIR